MSEALRRIGEVASSQWGLIATSEAGRIGVDRFMLSRLHSTGLLERIGQGVYRLHGAPEHEHEQILAAWLALAGSGEPVVAGAAAARLHGIGQLTLPAIDLASPHRRATRRAGVRFRHLELDPIDVVTAHGVPTMSPARTIVDVLELGEDPSNVGDMAAEALHAGLTTVPDIERALASRLHRIGGAGAELFVRDLERRTAVRPLAA